jgi:hypothetical protein
VVIGFLHGGRVDTQMWKGISFAAIAWMEWEHVGFSSLLDKRDTEIGNLKEAIKA